MVTQTGGLGVYNAEGHTDHLLPSAAKTARMILLIYNGLIIAGAVAYWAAGMTPFDAINISMCAVPTGGFATHGESIAYWNSPVIEAITIVLMVAGGTNFLLLFLLLRGKLKTDYTPHVDCGDFVIIINAEQAVLTGKKLEQKYYRTHSGYPGGLHETQYKKLMKDKPELAMRLAVRGMLQKNTIAQWQLKRLKIYRGAEHPHAAQKPEVWDR